MTDFATEVARYQAMEPEVLDAEIEKAARWIRQCQATIAAMRKAQRRQATLAKGGKLPQHTQQTTAQGGNQ
jgi:hypothetical protein